MESPASSGGSSSDGDGGDVGHVSEGAKEEMDPSARRGLIESIWEENQGPYEGMEFEDREAARVFYNEYARRLGFGTRCGSSRYSRRDNSVIAQRFVCSKEGFSKPRGKDSELDGGRVRLRRAFKRVGCRAMVAVKRAPESGKWVVYRIEKRHNHPLVAQENVRYLRSHRDLFDADEATPAAADRADSNGGTRVGTKEQSWPSGGKGLVEGECRNYIRIGRRRIMGSDVQDFLEYFRRKQSENPAFFCTMQVDEDQCVSNIFWADCKARMAYSYFGDAVVFDATHKSGLLPFVQFTGVNHHGQNVLFGCALLLDESESSLVWLFRKWLEAMSGRHPVSITTTIPDMNIKEAIAKVFPVTSYRICKSYVFRECQERLSYLYHLFPTFEEDLRSCIEMSETPEEFESNWWPLIDRYNLRNDEWIQSLYIARQDWVTAFLHDTFFAELSCAEKKKQRTSIFNGYINEEISLKDFIDKYEKALDNQYEKEAKGEFDTTHTCLVLKTPSPMEKQVSSLYTRKIFMKFQEELVETFAYTGNMIGEDGQSCIYKVTKYEEEHKTYTVLFNVHEKKASCSCQMFEFSGVLCRHILTVFRVTNILTLPSRYVLKRWTRNAMNGAPLDDSDAELQGNSRESLTLRYSKLRHQAIKFVEEGASSVDVYNAALAAIREAASKVAAAQKNIARPSS